MTHLAIRPVTALLFLALLSAPLSARDLRKHGPYRIGMSFPEFVGILRQQSTRHRMEVNPRAALFRPHAPLAPFRVWTFAPFYVDPRLTEEFVFNDGKLIGLITRERLEHSPFTSSAESRAAGSKERASEDRDQRDTDPSDPNEPPRLNESGRKLRDRLIERYGTPRIRSGREGIVYTWRREGTMVSYAFLRQKNRAFLEKTVLVQSQARVVYSGEGDYRTNLEVDALNNRVFRAPPATRDPTWSSGLYPYRVGPCDGYRGALDLFGCSLKIDFGDEGKKSK